MIRVETLHFFAIEISNDVLLSSVPFLAAATSWDQTYINLGNKFLSDTTNKILTQISDLIELDEPSINQDLLIACVAEKIFFDYRSIKTNVDETYEHDINEVFNQYKNIISSRAASGDMPDQCVQEIVCAVEQFKHRLLARAGKLMQGNMIDQIGKSIKIRLDKNGINPEKVNLINDELTQFTNNLLDNNEFNKLNAEKKAVFIQTNFKKMIAKKYDSDPNVQTIVNKARSVTLPIIRNHIDKFKADRDNAKTNLNDEIRLYQVKPPGETDVPKYESQLNTNIRPSEKSITSIGSTTSTSQFDQNTPNEFYQKDSRRISSEHDHHRQEQRSDQFRKAYDYDSQQVSNTLTPFTDCADYNPYGNYAKYKENRLHNNEQKNVY